MTVCALRSQKYLHLKESLPAPHLNNVAMNLSFFNIRFCAYMQVFLRDQYLVEE